MKPSDIAHFTEHGRDTLAAILRRVVRNQDNAAARQVTPPRIAANPIKQVEEEVKP